MKFTSTVKTTLKQYSTNHFVGNTRQDTGQDLLQQMYKVVIKDWHGRDGLIYPLELLKHLSCQNIQSSPI